MKINYWQYDLKFRHPFTISKGTKTHQPTLVVELDHLGWKGYGEAPAISYYNIPVDKMIDDLERKKSLVEKFAFTEPDVMRPVMTRPRYGFASRIVPSRRNDPSSVTGGFT